MVVGVCRIRLLLHEGASLKDKRRVVKGLIDRVRSRYNVSIAEVGDNDLWQSAEIGITAIGNDRGHVNSMADKTLDYIEGLGVAEVVDRQVELINV